MGKHLEQALPSVYTLQCLTGKVDNNNNSIHTAKPPDRGRNKKALQSTGQTAGSGSMKQSSTPTKDCQATNRCKNVRALWRHRELL